MAESTIEWTHYTFNPWLGCAKVHAGCTHCYAENHQAVAMRQGGRVRWGEVAQGGDRVITSDSYWRKPLTWVREAVEASERRRVFCASLADVLEVPTVPEAWPRVLNLSSGGIDIRTKRIRETAAAMDAARSRLWDIIRQTAAAGGALSWTGGADEWKGRPGLDWLLLTKRPENWEMVPEDVRPFVWLGTSVSNQETAGDMLPRLVRAKGFRFRFVSAEPMVGPINFH